MNDALDPWPLLALGGGVAAAAALVARSHEHTAPTIATAPAASATAPGLPTRRPAAWVFPVPSLGDRRAVISDGFDSMRTLASGEQHEVLKNFPTPQELTDAIAPVAAEAHLETLKYYWLMVARLK